MTVFHNEGAWDTSNVEFADGQIFAYEKQCISPRMKYIDYGLGVFQREAFAPVPEDTSYDLADLYQLLLKKRELAAFEVRERFYEIGSIKGLEELREALAHNS
jgi:NDP-sugar pyrophosphorylase family protein